MNPAAGYSWMIMLSVTYGVVGLVVLMPATMDKGLKENQYPVSKKALWIWASIISVLLMVGLIFW